MAVTNPATVRLPEDVCDWLADLAAVTATGLKPAATVPDAIRLIMATLDVELRRIPLTVGEASLLAEVRGGPILDAGLGIGVGAGIMLMDLADATDPQWATDGDLRPQFEERHGLPPGGVQALRDKLTTLGPAADLALRLALARWWQHDYPATSEGFREIGLRIIEP